VKLRAGQASLTLLLFARSLGGFVVLTDEDADDSIAYLQLP
jgi:hypothetical protein